MPDSSDWRRWITYAQNDLAAGMKLLEEFPTNACYCFQQSGEKFLKAMLIQRGIDPTRSHDVRTLLLLVDASIPSDSLEMEAARLLTFVGGRSRYPDSYSEPTVEQAQAVALAARAIEAFCLAQLPT